MSLEWVLLTPRTRSFKITSTVLVTRESAGVNANGELAIILVSEKEERTEEVTGQVDRVRLTSSTNAKSIAQFHIRMIYGRLSALGEFEPSIRDDGIVISGPNYYELDTNEDGLISEEELLQMSAKILKWDGEMREVRTLPVEGQAS